MEIEVDFLEIYTQMFIEKDMHSFSLGKELGYLGFHPLVLADTKFREREDSFWNLDI